MITRGIIHTELARHLAGLRHTERFVVCDSGLPLGDVPTVDLGYRYGAASFEDVVRTVVPQLTLERSWISRDMVDTNPTCLGALTAVGLSPEPIDHEQFKRLALDAKFAIRTGEATFYANVICQGGVPFSTPA
ncbi:MAG TPA: RbsD/FucU family protein [Flexivirga sp.]|uniref:RbsD/FucU family protein n=1 Tax=Flexivirga sp. TaxID=1962927 RepID=UPI002CCABC7B|nr:RbsD/FucU family protein [Flexivirga sp.]HWC21516.1 RbsD/FucU family protein [Flexivirga sp.]